MAAITVRRLLSRCPAVVSFAAVLVLGLLTVTDAVRYGQIAQTLHIGDELRNVGIGRSPVTVEVADFTDRMLQEVEDSASHVQDAVDAPLLHRLKRTANKTAPAAPNPGISVTQSRLNDTHTQLIVHWAGEGSNVIIALAKYNNDGGSSSLFVSRDYGKSFADMKRQLHNATIHRYYNSPIYNSHYVFTDIKSNRILTSRNFARSFFSYQLSFKPRTVSLHSTDPNIILAMDDKSERKNLYISRNFGATWTLMQSDVKSFFWGLEPWDSHNTLYVERQEASKNSVIIKSTNFFRTSQVLIRETADFELRSNYMFATKKVILWGARNPINLQLWVSRNRGPFRKAVFPGGLTELDYYIADASEDQVFVCVNHNKTTSHLYISDMDGLHYSLSLSSIIYFNPNGSNKDTWLRLYKDESFADIHKVDGLRGVYIASKLKNNSLILENQMTYITFDKGGVWQSVMAPQKDSDGAPTHCEQIKNCSLHLSQEFSKLYPGSKSVPILSKKSAPGLILASGTLGKNMKRRPNVYLSKDAGLRWFEVLKGNYFYAFGDFGGVIVAVMQFSITNELLYSKNMGETWNKFNFTKTPIRVYGLLTEPGETTTVFSIFGSFTGFHSWLILQVDTTKIFGPMCSQDDYKEWSLSDDDHFQGCLLGRKTMFKRRIPHADCLNGPGFHQISESRNCSCTRQDYECDYGFMEEGHRFHYGCIPDPNVNQTAIHEQPLHCPPDTFYRYTKGYRRVPGDTCEGGEQHRFDALMYSCPLEEKTEFLLYSNRHEIHQVELGGSDKDSVLVDRFLANAVALEFDYKDNCLFWADISVDVIKRLCLTNNTQLTTVVTGRLDTVEGLAYDWMGENLYWVDAGNQKIEVAKKDGRFRRVLINGTAYLDKPRSIVLDPENGYMYWSDWSTTNPRIVKASMDGELSSIHTIVNGSRNVYWPNGLAIDYQLGHLYWTDAHLDRIVRSDLNGTNRTILIQGSNVVPHPYSIAVFKGLIYWSDWSLRTIMAADKLTGGGLHTFLRVRSIMDIKIMTKNSQNGENLCSVGKNECSQLCLAKPGAPGRASRTCLCGDGMRHSVTGKERDEQCICQAHEDLINGSCRTTGNSSCSPQQFHCVTKKCIPLTWKCDHDDDCGDRSDEVDCGYHDCGSDMFTCNNRRCISKSWKCDHDDDCHDGSDEVGCTYPTCSPGQFSCKNNRCIPAHWRCDLDNDCHDGSDEENCTVSNTCRPEQILCAGTEHQCIPKVWLCDGGQDCPNGTDEHNCHTHTCAPNYFQCNNSKCVVMSYLCDGQDDCGDKSDEDRPECKTVSTIRPPVITTPVTGQCHRWQFRCNNGHCVWWSVHCDGINDCGDNSDERNCHYNVTTSTMKTTTTSFGHCLPEQFTCSDGHCLYPSWVCDGTNDCSDGEDERGCIDTEGCRSGFYACTTLKECIKDEYVCNGNRDCSDGSDEKNCNSTLHPACNFPWTVPCRDSDSCVEPYQMCDGYTNCFDGSDEIRACRNIPRVKPQVSGVTSTEVTLKWKAPKANVSYNYTVAYINLNIDVPREHNNTTPQTTLTLSKLTPFSHYRVFIYVQEKIGGKTVVHYPGAPEYFFTRAAVPSCPADLYLHHVSLDGNEVGVRVIWAEPAPKNGILLLYKIFYKDASKPKSDKALFKALLKSDFPNAKHGKKFWFDLDDLDMGKKYYIWVTAVNNAGEAKCDTSKKSILFGSGFIKPVRMNVDKTTTTSITLKWDLSADVLSYNLRYHNIWAQPVLLTTQKSPFTISNLSPGQLYNFVIQPYNASTNGSISSIQARTTGTSLQVPQNVTLNYVGRDKITVGWTYPKVKNQTFRIFYKYKGDSIDDFAVGALNVTTTTGQLSATITNLVACETYAFAVAVNGPIKSRLTRLVFQPTDADRTSPPKNLKVKPIPGNLTCFNLTWETSCFNNPEPLSYFIEVVEILDGKSLPPYNSYVNMTNSTHMHRVLCNATRGAEYRLRVQTLIRGVSTNFSEPETFQTERYKAPSDFRLLGASNDTLNFTWRDPEELPKDHEHMLQFQKDGADFLDYGFTPNMSIGFPLSRLVVNSTYAFRIQLYINKRRGEASNELLYAFDTQTALPPESAAATSSTNLVAIVAPISAVVVILVIILLVYVVRHHRLQRSFLSFARSHYDTRSGTTTFTSDDLGEDEDSPMITGFSDDEPLVLA